MPKRIPIAEKDIAELHQRPEGTVSEDELKAVLRRYNLRDALITIGKASFYIYSSRDPNNIYKVAHREPETGIILSQWALAYLANIFLISGSNDYKSKYLSTNPDNLFVLCNLYGNNLLQPEMAERKEQNDQEVFRSLMVRINFEQIEYQLTPVYIIARTIVLFDNLAKEVAPARFNPLPDILEHHIGLTTHDYLLIAMAVLSGVCSRATFRPSMFVEADVPRLKSVLKPDKIQRFLAVLASDYKQFRTEDEKANKVLNPSLTKTRLNPLWIYPIIESDDKQPNDAFIVPNALAYIKAAFGGLYWWFHRHFEKEGIQQEFRNYFGYLFQEYVGVILKGIYGDEKVHPELVYDRGKKFVDWWVERDSKIYLFEAKANQFALASRQTGAAELIVESEIRKVAEAIEQVYKRVQDISRYDELALFRSKQVIPFVVFLDMPYISGPMYEDWIKKYLEKIETEKTFKGLQDFPCFLLNIEELELFDAGADTIELESIFPVLRQNFGEDFLSVVRRATGRKELRNRFLDNIYKNFFTFKPDPM
jgi:hypothetical protein